MTRIYVFPGQGSQKVGMGQELFSRFPDLTAEANDELGYDIADLCINGPEDKLGSTDYTQPALYVVNAFSYLAKVADTGEVPAYLAGHSLGEYNALLAAGAFDFATGLRLVNRRGAMMAKATGGGMAAILGLTGIQVRNIIADKGLTHIDVANLNAPTQTVISGPSQEIINAEPIFKEAGARMYVILNVSGAFHSRYMMAAAEEFRGYLLDAKFNQLEIPVIANCSAEPYRFADIAENLASQIYSSVRWVDTIKLLLEQPDPEFEEIGPGKVLAGLIRQIRKG